MNHVLPLFRTWVLRAILLSPSIVLLIAAVPRFASGVALEAAFPVPSYMVTDRSLPINTYRATFHVLEGASVSDGETQIARARAAYLSGEVGPKFNALVDQGLSHAPASVAGWTLLSVLRTPAGEMQAADAIAVALELAPHDYYLAAWRARAAASLWDNLSADARDDAKRVIREMWSNRELHHEFRAILAAQGGARLVTAAMVDDPDGLRALNRMVARERLGLPDGN